LASGSARTTLIWASDTLSFFNLAETHLKDAEV